MFLLNSYFIYYSSHIKLYQNFRQKKITSNLHSKYQYELFEYRYLIEVMTERNDDKTSVCLFICKSLWNFG